MDQQLREIFAGKSDYEISVIIDRVAERLEIFNDRMIDKFEVAERAGMTVSWLDNSRSKKAMKLRSLGVRYGKSQTSPVRYPLIAVVRACRMDES